MIDWAILLEKSLALAIEAHQGQRQKDGKPYILHPLHLMMQHSQPNAQITALLHDVVEDTTVTFADLMALGIPDEIIDALKLLTHAPEVSYPDYIKKIKLNSLARQVKLADLTHNMDIRRLPTLTGKASERMKKYHLAWRELSDEAD